MEHNNPYAKFGIIKFVLSSDLESATRDGWRLLEIHRRMHPEARAVRNDGIAPGYYSPSGYDHGPQTMMLTTSQFVAEEEIWCLVALDEESAVKKLTDTCSQLTKEIAVLKDAELKNHKKIADDVAMIHAVNERIINTQNVLGTAQKERDAAEARVRVMEIDMATLRKAMGELRFKEILESKSA